MSTHRWAAKRDANEGDIVDMFRSLGCTVERLSGKGIPDLLVGHLGRNRLVEVKVANEALNEGQAKWHDEWVKHGERPEVCRSPAHASKLVRLWTLEAKAPRHDSLPDLAYGKG